MRHEVQAPDDVESTVGSPEGKQRPRPQQVDLYRFGFAMWM